MADFRFPNITAPDDSGRLRQLETYLFQLTNQLNYAIKSTEEIEAGNTDIVIPANNGEQQLSEEDKKKADTFYALKDFIINSADIVEAYSEEIKKKLSGEYVAQSEFGNFVEQNNATYKLTPEEATALFEKVETIDGVVDAENGTIDGISMFRSNKFYIKTGWLGVEYDEKLGKDVQIGGMEIGQISTDGETYSDVKFARFTPEKLEFYIKGSDKPIAYMSGLQLVITNARLTGNLELNRYLIDTQRGLAFKWMNVGGE